MGLTLKMVLINELDSRLSVGGRWLVHQNGCWVIYEKRQGKSFGFKIHDGSDLESALHILIKEA